MEAWSLNKSRELYNIANWGDGYFHVNSQGNIAVRPERNGLEVDLHKLVQSLVERGIKPPVLIRFDGILRNRVSRFAKAFSTAISESNYGGTYKGVFPIKVNQQRHVVDTIRLAGRDTNLGLEVGSKPELIAVLAIHDNPGGLLLCNGYKDDEYIELALMGRKIGRRAIVIIEQFYELNQILEQSAKVGVEAEIGIRMKPSSKGSGHWEDSSGDKAKFGLTIPEIVAVIERLKSEGKLHWLKLLHFHIGSQITSIAAIKRALREASRMYSEIAKLAPSLCFFDAGGGLGVDYDGSRTSSDSSMNYSIEEYARDVIDAVGHACTEAGLAHPDIVTESGRALTAHHAILITQVMDVAWTPGNSTFLEAPVSDHEVLHKIYAMFNDLSVKNCHETLNDALAIKDDVLDRFNQGDLNLIERAYADKAIWLTIAKIKSLAANLRQIPEDLQRLNDEFRDLYFCNFSVFQSTPDSWAIDQLFPIAPIHRLNEHPSREASLADACCDNEGRIDHFIDLRDVKSYVHLHPFKKNEPYYLGIFLVGAYQEVLGDLYNLYGDTHAIHVDLKAEQDGSTRIELTHLVEGDTVREILEYLEYDAPELVEKFRVATERSAREGQITHEQGAKLQKRVKEALDSSTYLDL